ncbi:hypothetical protein Bbelb_344110 [Branchiostoma belcheri]|nr:hypothetical protein Bbelb_344110 [Branchiostoma belcheri]
MGYPKEAAREAAKNVSTTEEAIDWLDTNMEDPANITQSIVDDITASPSPKRRRKNNGEQWRRLGVVPRRCRGHVKVNVAYQTSREVVAPNVFPRNGRRENRAIYRKVVQVSNDVTERKEWADLLCCFVSTTTTTNGASRLRALLENVLNEDGLSWGRVIIAMIFALDVNIKLHGSQTNQENAICSELAELMCAIAGRWLLRRGFLDAPMLIENVADMERFLQAITEIDILEIARQARPDSKWVVHILTNVTFYVDKLTDHPIGAFDELPDFIRHSRAIIGLDSGSNGQYKDNLCFFRCLAVHRAGAWHRNIEKPAKELFQAYLEFSGKTRKEFKGVTLGELTVLEALFHTNIYVYSLRKDTDGSVFAELVRRPVMKFQDTMYLNLYANHLSYIKDFNSYSKSWSCQVCSRKFTHHGHLMVHQRQCTGSTSFVYPGGTFQLTSNIFDKLQDEGVSIPREQRIYPYRVTWDIECLLKPLAEQNSEKMTWEAVHELLSVSVSSNVPGFTTPKCFVSDGEPKVVADDFLAYIEQISHHAYKTLREAFGWVFNEILDKRH